MALPLLAYAQQSGADTTLQTITVEAPAQTGVTEGTNSYISGESSTATPLNLSPRETPQSVSVVTQQRIEDQKFSTITDVMNNTTGVSVTQYETNRAQFVSRGFDINTLMIDGVPTTWDQPWSSGEVFTSLAPYDHVEIVRGATGLTTGAGDPSGAVNLVRKRADATEFQGNVELFGGSWNQYGGSFDISTPVNEAKTVRARVVGEYNDQGSWVKNLHNKNQTLFATVEADLTPRTLLTAGFSYQELDTRGPMWGGLPVWYSNGLFTNWDRSTTSSAPWTSWDASYTTYFASLVHRFDNDWRLQFNYNHGERKADSYLLYAYGAPDIVTGQGMAALPGSYNVETTQDDFALRADGRFGWFGRTHEVAFGYVSSSQDFHANDRPATPAFGVIGDFNAFGGTLYPQPVWGPETYYGKAKTDQDAVYGTARFSLTDPMHLIVGARVTNYHKSGDDVYSNPYDLKYDGQVTPYLGLTYDLTKQLTAYASYTDIFLPQNARDITGSYIQPVTGKNFETGLKGAFLDGKLNASGAIFRIEQQNLAVATTQTIVGIGGLPETAYRASDGATSQGFEFELSGQIAPDWNLTSGYTQFSLKDAVDQNVNTRYPRKLLRLFTTYRLPGALSGLTIGGGLSWQSETYTDAVNALGISQRITQGAYGLVSLMARYDFNPRLSLQLNVNNVTDKKYFALFDAYDQLTFGAPRNATATLRYKF